jgi:hypothetical protein
VNVGSENSPAGIKEILLRSQTTPATVVIRLILFGAGLACAVVVAGLAAAGHLERLTMPGLLFLVIAPSALAVALAYVAIWQPDRVARWRPRRHGRRLAGELSILALSLIVVEVLLMLWAPNIPSQQLTRKKAADKLGRPFDTRTVSEVVAQLRADGIDALPGLTRQWPLLPFVHERLPTGLYPLSHASNAAIVECNEGGEYLVYQTDEYGFHNPRGLLASRQVGIAAIGESHALGHCVPPAQSLVGRLRNRYPGTANVAMAGSYALATLASFREYVEPLRPPVVLWIANPHSLVDDDEQHDPILTRYLDPTFSQRLLERQSQVDRLVRTISIPAQAELDRAAKAAIEQAEAPGLVPILSLRRLRERNYVPLWRPPEDKEDPQPFVRSVLVAKEATERWGGVFVLVILPTHREVVRKIRPPLWHKDVRQTLTERGTQVIDAVPVFSRQPDPSALFTLRIHNHPTAEANELLANYLVQELERRFAQRLASLR